MLNADYILIPVRRFDGSIRAHATIDAEDEHLAAHSWHLDRDGYARRSLPRSGGKRMAMFLHREVLGLTHGDGLQADHIDGDRLNCRRANLRVAMDGQNQQNRASKAGSSSRYRGVTWHKRGRVWQAGAMLNGVHHHLGHFADEQEAAVAAQAWRVANMPFTNEQRVAAIR